jgi:type VI secretion system secreted protein VgrG
MPRVMSITTPLGEDLLFHGMSAREEMSRLFAYDVTLLSKRDDIKLDEILGQNVTISLVLPNESVRAYNGYVTRFRQGGQYGRYTQYVAVVRPWLWFLTRTADCRIFQEMKVPDIIKQVFSDNPAADYKLDLTGSYRKWTYCVQYRETDFNFVSRLMEQEGIGYYFRHSDGKNTLVLTDSASKHSPRSEYEKLSYIGAREQVRPDFEHVTSWSFGREIQPGVYVHDDYDFERPGVELKTNKSLPRGHKASDSEVYDYPGDYIQVPDGQQYAEVRMEEFGTQFEAAQASTNARGLTVGSLLTLEDHPRHDQNREYLITAANFDLRFGDYEALHDAGDTNYQCSFTAMPTSQQFRPKRITPKPFVQGPQTAVVVGPGGEEIYTDKYGRVKVQFHWDRRGKKDENSSCWIRVSHPWAGKQWGAVALPRIGQEVIVDFLEGDPDQPIITGRVYNAEQMPPYELPANKTQSGVKSRSSLNGSAANFNELRFEDKKGSELVTLHAEKDQSIGVEHDEAHWVGHDRTKTIDHDETTHVKHDRTETVDHDETITVHGKRTEVVDKDENITIHMNRVERVDKDESISIGGSMNLGVDRSKSETVTINSAETVGVAKELSVGGLYQVSVGAAFNTTVGAAMGVEVVGASAEAVGGGKTIGIGGDHSITIGGADTVTVAKDQGVTVKGQYEATVTKEYTVKAKTITLQAEDEILISVGKAKIAMKKDGTVTIEGKDLSMKASGKINQKADGDVIVKGSKIAQN